MLLGNKKTQGEEQNWCLVLSPLRNEIDKKKVAQKISEVFSLSLQEASDVVANTPIILLDQLNHSIALKVKEYFHSAGAEMILTNDTFLKRKCYRTVWPEPPNLSFLHELHPLHEVPEASEELPPEEALQEIRSLKDEPLMSVSQQEILLEEVERWKKECLALREECGKYELLREEYRQARSLFEEKTAAVMQENERLKKRLNAAEVLNQTVQDLLKSREELERRLHEEREERVQAEERLQASLKQLEAREQELESARRQVQDLSLQAEQRAEDHRKAQMAGRLLEKEAYFKGLVKEQERIENEIREREEAIRKILTEQESVEKEILEARAARRHLEEPAKKEERLPRLKIEPQSHDRIGFE